MSESASESARRLWVVHSVVRWDSLLSNTLVLWVVELLSGFFFFCGIPRVLEAVSGDCVCVSVWVLLFRGRRSRGREKGSSKRRRKRDRERQREKNNHTQGGKREGRRQQRGQR